jgi:hypothetical protein
MHYKRAYVTFVRTYMKITYLAGVNSATHTYKYMNTVYGYMLNGFLIISSFIYLVQGVAQ